MKKILMRIHLIAQERVEIDEKDDENEGRMEIDEKEDENESAEGDDEENKSENEEENKQKRKEAAAGPGIGPASCGSFSAFWGGTLCGPRVHPSRANPPNWTIWLSFLNWIL